MSFRPLLYFAAFFLVATHPMVSRAQDGAPSALSTTGEDTSDKIPALGASGEQKLTNHDVQGAIADFKQAFELSRQLAKELPQEPAYTENAYYYLGRLASAFSSGGDQADALKMQEPSAQGYADLAAANGTPENKEKAAAALGQLAWYQLANRNPQAAVASSQKALELDPSLLWVKTNLAHGLLLSGKVEEAKAIYSAEQAQEVGDGRTFKDAVLADFDELEKLGIQDVKISTIRAFYGAPEVKQTSNAGLKSKGSVRIWPYVVGVFALIGGLIVLFVYLERKRTEKVAAICNSLGYRFRRKPTDEDRALILNTHLMTRGSSRSICNVIEAEGEGTNVTVFDFTYSSGTGDNERSSTQTIAQLTALQLNLPAFVLLPETLFAKIAQSFGYKDIDFEQYPKFSSMYLLRGADEAAIRGVFTPAVLSYCEQQRGLCIESIGDRLLVYREDRRISPEELENFVNKGREIFALFAMNQQHGIPPLLSTGTPPPLPV